MVDPRPEPPSDLSQRPLPLEVLPAGTRLFRIHQSDRTPVFFGPPGSSPESRFDDPHGQFKVCYLGLEPEAAIVETLLREPQRRTLSWSGDVQVRSLAEFEAARDLRVADFGGDGLRALGATLEVLGTREYALSNAWSRAIWEHPDTVDGIFYVCRHDNRTTALALFELAAPAIHFIESRPLMHALRWLGEMSVRYRFGLTA